MVIIVPSAAACDFLLLSIRLYDSTAVANSNNKSKKTNFKTTRRCTSTSNSSSSKVPPSHQHKQQ